jgi:hypothetical protein
VRAELKTCALGAALIDLQRDTACGLPPRSRSDADAVRKALQEWSQAEKRRPVPTRASVAQAVFDMRAAESRANRDAQRWSHGETAFDVAVIGTDLFDLAIEGLGDLLGAVDVF